MRYLHPGSSSSTGRAIRSVMDHHSHEEQKAAIQSDPFGRNRNGDLPFNLGPGRETVQPEKASMMPE